MTEMSRSLFGATATYWTLVRWDQHSLSCILCGYVESDKNVKLGRECQIEPEISGWDRNAKLGQYWVRSSSNAPWRMPSGSLPPKRMTTLNYYVILSSSIAWRQASMMQSSTCHLSRNEVIEGSGSILPSNRQQ